MYSEYSKVYIVTKVHVIKVQVPGRQVAGAGQISRRCRADRAQVPGRQVVAGAGQTGRRCRADRWSQVPGRQVTGASINSYNII